MKAQRNSEFSIQNVLHLDRALRLVWQSGPGWTIASLALVLVQGVLPLASLYLMKLVIDAVTAGLAAPDKEAAFGRVVFLIILTGAVALIGSAVQAAHGLVTEAQGLNVTDRVQDIIHAKSIEADLEYYENSQYYDTLHRAQQEAP